MFPVMTVPGYFLFVLIRSCFLNEIMLFRDSKMITNLCLVLFWMIHRVSKWNFANFFCLQWCRPGWPMEHPKNWCVFPLQQGLCGKMAMWILDGWGDCCLQMSEGLFPVCVVGSWRNTPRSSCAWPLACALAGTWPFTKGHLFSSQGSSGALQTSGTHLHSTSLPWLVSSSCTSQKKMKDGFSCSMRDFRKIRHLVWGFAWALKIMVFVLEEIGLLASKASTQSHYLQSDFCVCMKSTWLLGKLRYF